MRERHTDTRIYTLYTVTYNIDCSSFQRDSAHHIHTQLVVVELLPAYIIVELSAVLVVLLHRLRIFFFFFLWWKIKWLFNFVYANTHIHTTMQQWCNATSTWCRDIYICSAIKHFLLTKLEKFHYRTVIMNTDLPSIIIIIILIDIVIDFKRFSFLCFFCYSFFSKFIGKTIYIGQKREKQHQKPLTQSHCHYSE